MVVQTRHSFSVTMRPPLDGRYRLAIDVGGTFTDFVILDEATGRLSFEKVLTTAADPSRGILSGVGKLLTEPQFGPSGLEPTAINQVIHATTLVGNAIIERKGARTSLICTRGFKDILTLGREWRYDIYDSHLTLPHPVVLRRDRFEVTERLGASGEVIIPLSRGEIEGVIDWLRQEGFPAVAVSLLHSYRNDTHERLLRDAIQDALPGLAITISSQVLPQAGEYERTCAAVMNASVQPLTTSYLDRLVSGLAARGVHRDLLCMSSTGGLVSAKTAARFPIRLLESGPVAGALGAAHYGTALQHGNLLAFDMGGTTAKACVIEDGRPGVTNEFEVARVQRLTKGSGLPVKMPAIDVLEIGAGGGSIARINDLGLVTVGPDSAGADPGPICYGLGGQLPTVTDANLLLGYLNPDYFLGGALKLDLASAERALTELGTQAGLSAARVSWGIHEIVSQNMANALRTHAIEKGADYRGFALVAFGGAGPMHAFRIAHLLNIPRVTFPWGAGVFSAVGLLTAPLQFDVVRTRHIALNELNSQIATSIYGELEEQLASVLADAGVSKQRISFQRTADLRYIGQGMEITVDVPRRLDDRAAFAEAFERAYKARYGWGLRSGQIEIVNWRCTARSPLPDFSFRVAKKESDDRLLKDSRQVYLGDGEGFQECLVYNRYAMPVGLKINGPSLVEEKECTLFVGPRATAVVDGSGGLQMTLSE